MSEIEVSGIVFTIKDLEMIAAWLATAVHNYKYYAETANSNSTSEILWHSFEQAKKVSGKVDTLINSMKDENK